MLRRIRSALPLHRHSIPQILADGVLLGVAYWAAFRLRFDQGIPALYEELLRDTIAWVVVGGLIVFVVSRMYGKWWRFSGQRDLLVVVRSVVLVTLALVFGIAVFHPVTRLTSEGEVGLGLPSSVVALFALIAIALLCGARLAARIRYERPRGFRPRGDARSVLIVGAGNGGRHVLEEILRNRDLRLNPVGFVDDDPTKIGMRLHGVRVLGTTQELPRILEEVEPDEVLIAIPSAPGTLRARIVGACRKRGIPVRTLPTVFELLQGGSSTYVRQVREVQVEDVLGREPVRFEERVGRYLDGEVVLVTGAGGSIGSELCRQIARGAPRRLILLDHAEDNLFRIQRELEDDRHVHPSHLAAVLADCKEEERMREVFRDLRPSVVFHAAAYKHVGLMELNPVEAVRNNALATRVMARVAGDCAAKRFVLISTDKAVAPATVMGASKALAEFAVEEASGRYPQTRYATVRFGNVLGSSGSVVPIFRQQIAKGGPVTVTDERMTRYFMTIPEAVQLILQASLLPELRGQIAMLDMGEPVKIRDLAVNLLRLAGVRGDLERHITYTGLRPGEKLHEELVAPDECARPTKVAKVRMLETPARSESIIFEVAEWERELAEGRDEVVLAALMEEFPALRIGGEKVSSRERVQHAAPAVAISRAV